MRRETLPPEHFDRIYAARPDPWSYRTSAYERAKYAATLAALPEAHYRNAFEIGCSAGIFTAMLAERCDALVAAEPAAAPRAEAAARFARQPSIRIVDLWVPRDWPEGRFDLVLISEVVDYLGGVDVLRLAERVLGSLDPGGDVVLVHWVGKKRGPPSGDEASDRFIAATASALDVVRAERNADYRLDVLTLR